MTVLVKVAILRVFWGGLHLQGRVRAEHGVLDPLGIAMQSKLLVTRDVVLGAVASESGARDALVPRDAEVLAIGQAGAALGSLVAIAITVKAELVMMSMVV